MGRGIRWTCNDCGYEFSLTYLGGSRTNEEWTMDDCESGKYGELAQYLISDDCPVPIFVSESSEIYHCPECHGLFERWTLNLWAENDSHWFTARNLSETCPNGCDCRLEGPYDGDEALKIIEEHWPANCPECGREASLRGSDYIT